MNNPTHFIEVYKSNYTGNVMVSKVLNTIDKKELVLTSTKGTKDLHTTFVWIIKLKK